MHKILSSFIPHPSSLLASLLIVSAMVLWGCGENSSSHDDLPPSRPHWIPRSGDDIPAQQGIRPEPTESNAHYWVHVEWYANPEPDVAGYQIWRLDEGHPLHDRYVVADLRVGMNPETPAGASRYSWVDRGDSASGAPLNVLAPDIQTRDTRGYFWLIVAYDTAGNRSEVSDSAYFRMMYNPQNIRVSHGFTNSYEVGWEYVPNDDALVSYYVVRIFPAARSDSLVYYQQAQSYTSTGSIIMDLSSLANNASYTCQLNVVSTRTTAPGHADSLAGAAVKTAFTVAN
jgi:hypothetical protein